jgi:hypothetical protein
MGDIPWPSIDLGSAGEGDPAVDHREGGKDQVGKVQSDAAPPVGEVGAQVEDEMRGHQPDGPEHHQEAADSPRMERGGDVLVAVPKPVHGDEDIAAPKTIHTGGSVRMRSLGRGVTELLIENKLVVG